MDCWNSLILFIITHQTHHDFPIRKHLHGIECYSKPLHRIRQSPSKFSSFQFILTDSEFCSIFTGYGYLMYYFVRYFMIAYHAIILTSIFQWNLIHSNSVALVGQWVCNNNYTIFLNHIKFNRRVLFPFVLSFYAISKKQNTVFVLNIFAVFCIPFLSSNSLHIL